MGGLPDFLPDPGVSVTIIKSLFRGQYYNVHVLGFYMFYGDYAYMSVHLPYNVLYNVNPDIYVTNTHDACGDEV